MYTFKIIIAGVLVQQFNYLFVRLFRIKGEGRGRGGAGLEGDTLV